LPFLSTLSLKQSKTKNVFLSLDQSKFVTAKTNANTKQIKNTFGFCDFDFTLFFEKG